MSALSKEDAIFIVTLAITILSLILDYMKMRSGEAYVRHMEEERIPTELRDQELA